MGVAFVPLVGFVIGNHERPIEDYFDASVMEERLRAVHKYGFALAFNSLLSASSEPTSAAASTEPFEGSVDFVLYGVLVSRTISAIVEALLVITGLCAILLCFFIARLKSNLCADPGSLADLVTVLRNSPELVDAVSPRRDGPRRAEPESSRDSNPNLRLTCDCSHAFGTMSIEVIGDQAPCSIAIGQKAAKVLDEQGGDFKPIKPTVLRRSSGAIFILLLIATVCILVFLKRQEQLLGGLPDRLIASKFSNF
ncbi:unnamed protein product [Parascedosporium putredinis]|uniref:Uncharacterized protein n=1 Tax=Parascedosporium putredinis TaxID=1442378 RepID=A0A9P1GU87_9PEZI|nr:unnamed protein product [Parascedosporium putredinis]CAI7987438.1 unnamed protein product [Parascedosporium putredinis]